MRQLLDTHTFLWFVSGNPELSEKAKNQILLPVALNFVSMASLWEIAIKLKLGKLKIKGSILSIIDDLSENNMEVLPINFGHIVKSYEYDFHHRDPFDRIIIAQAEVENMLIIGKDEIFDKYLTADLQRIW
ncbi:MAG: type II toxin-antitoxin system VapC family toxin [Bacteroidales bacterium]